MSQAQRVLNLLIEYEQAVGFVDKQGMYAAIEAAIDHPPLTFILFSCLAVERNKEELVLSLEKTMFFDGGTKTFGGDARRAIRLVQEIEAMGIAVAVIPILVDTEPRRTWGWQVPQAELTLACQLMIEGAASSEILPKNWHPTLWSDIERQSTGSVTFEHVLERGPDHGKHRLLVAQQEKHLRGFSSVYRFSAGVHEAAVRQVAAYALEGLVLEDVYPRGVLLQSERPWQEKDPLYQWLRLAKKKGPLLIVHPFRQ